MKRVAEKDIDDPDQLFFDFARPVAAPRSAAAEAHTLANNAVQPAAAAQARQNFPVQAFRQAEPPAVLEAPASQRTFLTEARVIDIFRSVAGEEKRERIRSIRLVFKPFRSTLYSYAIRPQGMAIVKLHIAFRSAPERVLRQVAQLMFTSRRDGRRSVDRAAYDQFVRAIPPTDFELPGARKARRMALPDNGRHHSLAESFARVNATYFKSTLEQPELCWSPARARRILGSYQERTDRLIISQIFDSPKIPTVVLDFLMYHELLHKFLGIGRKGNGRRNLHGPDFRALEKQYGHFDEVQRFLKKL